MNIIRTPQNPILIIKASRPLHYVTAVLVQTPDLQAAFAAEVTAARPKPYVTPKLLL